MTIATFRAGLPHIGGAIKIHGEGGLRLTLDVSESDVPEALQLALMRGKPLIVSICIDDGPVPFEEPDHRDEVAAAQLEDEARERDETLSRYGMDGEIPF